MNEIVEIRDRMRCKVVLILCLLLVGHLSLHAGIEGSSRVIFAFGPGYMFMKPNAGADAHGFKLHIPGWYFRAGAESFYDETRFIHSELCLSIYTGSTDFGPVKTSRLNYNYGIGWEMKYFKLSLNPGLCYVSAAYQNNITGKTFNETRFAPSMGFQSDLNLINTERHYLSLFTEVSVMMSLNSKWVNQIAAGICFNPFPKKKVIAKVDPFMNP